MSGSNCCFLTCIHVSQETGKVVTRFKKLQAGNYRVFRITGSFLFSFWSTLLLFPTHDFSLTHLDDSSQAFYMLIFHTISIYTHSLGNHIHSSKLHPYDNIFQHKLPAKFSFINSLFFITFFSFFFLFKTFPPLRLVPLSIPCISVTLFHHHPCRFKPKIWDSWWSPPLFLNPNLQLFAESCQYKPLPGRSTTA